MSSALLSRSDALAVLREPVATAARRARRTRRPVLFGQSFPLALPANLVRGVARLRAAGEETFLWERGTDRLSMAGIGQSWCATTSGPGRFRDIAAARDVLLGDAILASEGPRGVDGPIFFGAFSFDPEMRPDGPWHGLPASRLVLPRLLVVRRDRRCAVTLCAVVDPDSTDGGFDSIRFITPIGTWQYHKVGAGFSSLDDTSGNDWIGWSTASGSGGAYRGIPNLAFNSGYFHPGGEGNPCTTTLQTQGPVRSTLTSISQDGEWELRWDIYPAYAQLDVVRRDPSESYWFLYEGTPGGAIDLATDYSVRPDGTRLPLGTSWDGDLPGEEWVYVEDSALDRSLYVIQHQPDSNTDSYWPLNGDMTVLGFGRLNLNTYLSAAPNVFTVGLADDADFTNMQGVIDSAYRPLAISVGLAEEIPAEAAYEVWARGRFGDAAVDNPALEDTLWGMFADPEGDGLINALEQITGLDPLLNDAASAFKLEERPDGSLVFQYRLAKDLSRWQVTPEYTHDLALWHDLPGVPVLRADLGDAELWELPLPDAGDGIVFARLSAGS